MGAKGAWRKKVNERLERDFAVAECAGMPLVPGNISVRNALRLRAEAGLVLEPLHGMFVRTTHWNGLPRQTQILYLMRGLQKKHPNWIFSHQSAAVAHGLPVARWHLSEVHIVLPPGAHARRSPGCTFHISTCEAPCVTMRIQVTPIEQTVLDCACTLPFRDGLAIADAAARFYHIDAARMLAYAVEHGGGKRGIRHARMVFTSADGRAESWGESVARALMIELGFEVPQLQVDIELPEHLGGPRRVDFLWTLPDGSSIIGEFDGKEKYAMGSGGDGGSLDVLLEERQRESRLTVLRAAIVRFTFEDLKDPLGFTALLDSFGVPHARKRG